MKITIHLEFFANLKKYTPNTFDRFVINAGSSIKEILEQLQVPQQKSLLIIIDEKRGDEDYQPTGGETIKVFPPMRGG